MILWPEHIVKAWEAKPTLRNHPDSIRHKVEGVLRCLRRDNPSPELEEAIELFLRSETTKPVLGDTLLDISPNQIWQVIRLMVAAMNCKP